MPLIVLMFSEIAWADVSNAVVVLLGSLCVKFSIFLKAVADNDFSLKSNADDGAMFVYIKTKTFSTHVYWKRN